MGRKPGNGRHGLRLGDGGGDARHGPGTRMEGGRRHSILCLKECNSFVDLGTSAGERRTRTGVGAPSGMTRGGQGSLRPSRLTGVVGRPTLRSRYRVCGLTISLVDGRKTIAPELHRWRSRNWSSRVLPETRSIKVVCFVVCH